MKYLKENRSKTNTEIADLLKRSSKTIWTTYKNAVKKHPAKIAEEMAGQDVFIPLSLFTDRTLGVQEAMVRYLREEKRLSYHLIAVMLNRDDRTIWTVYSRVKKKNTAERQTTKKQTTP